ncbi:hypothetical protein V8E55_008298 [Tylopilus felleus]
MFAKFSTLTLVSLWLSYVSALKLSVEPDVSSPGDSVTIKFTRSEGDPTKVNLSLEQNHALHSVLHDVTVAPTVEVTIPQEHPGTYKFAATWDQKIAFSNDIYIA